MRERELKEERSERAHEKEMCEMRKGAKRQGEVTVRGKGGGGGDESLHSLYLRLHICTIFMMEAAVRDRDYSNVNADYTKIRYTKINHFLKPKYSESTSKSLCSLAHCQHIV